MRIKSKLAAGIAAVGILVAGMFGVAAGQAQPGNDTVCEDYETLWEELEEGELVAIQMMEKHGLEIDMNDHDYEQKRDAAPPELRDRLLHLEALITRAEAAWLCENPPPPATGQAQPGNDTVCEDYETLWQELEEGALVAIQLMKKHGLEIDMDDHDYEQKRDAAPPELRDRMLHLEALWTRAQAAWLCENPPPPTTPTPTPQPTPTPTPPEVWETGEAVWVPVPGEENVRVLTAPGVPDCEDKDLLWEEIYQAEEEGAETDLLYDRIWQTELCIDKRLVLRLHAQESYDAWSGTGPVKLLPGDPWADYMEQVNPPLYPDHPECWTYMTYGDHPLEIMNNDLKAGFGALQAHNEGGPANDSREAWDVWSAESDRLWEIVREIEASLELCDSRPPQYWWVEYWPYHEPGLPAE